MAGAGRCRTLRSVPGRTSGVAVDGCAAGCLAWRCRRVRTTLLPSPVSAAPGACGCRCPPAASSVRASGPSLSAGCADLARNPAGVRGTGHRGRVRGAAGSAAGYLPGAGRTAAVHRGGAAALSRAGTPRPPVADRPGTPADCGSGTGRRLRTQPGVRGALRNCGHLATPSGRLDGGRGAGVRSAAELDAVSVRCPPLRPETAAWVRTAAVRPGPCRSLPVSAATGTGRLAGGCWRGAATAGRRGRAGGRAGRRAGRAHTSWPGAPTPGPPRRSARRAAGP
jgi:hypothetical protein